MPLGPETVETCDYVDFDQSLAAFCLCAYTQVHLD